MIAIVVIAIAAPFFIPGPDGTPIMTLEKLNIGSFSLPDIGLGDGTEDSGVETVYRYQDDQGVWHYTDQVPVDNSAEQIEVSTDINLIQAPPAAPETPTSQPEISANPLTAITRGAEVMDDAQAVQQMLDDRAEQMDQSLNEAR